MINYILWNNKTGKQNKI